MEHVEVAVHMVPLAQHKTGGRASLTTVGACLPTGSTLFDVDAVLVLWGLEVGAALLQDELGQLVEDVGDVDACLGTGLDEGDAEGLCQLLTLLGGDHPGVFFVAFVADDDHLGVLLGVLLHRLVPSFHAVKRVLVADVVHYDDAHCAPVVCCRDGSEPLLAGRVPYLELDFLSVQVDCFDFEVDSNCRDERGIELVVHKPQEQTRLSDPRVSHH